MDGAGKNAERECMKQKYMFAAALLLILSLASIGLTEAYTRYTSDHTKKPGSGNGQAVSENTAADLQAEHPFQVVTSFYPIYIAAKNIVGDCEGVTLQNLSEPQTGCMHDYQLTTGDMRSLSAADAFMINGGGMESFLPDVADQYPNLAVIDASAKTVLLEENAHVWMSIASHMTQVATMADSLATLDPAHADIYQDNAAAYLKKLETLRRRQQKTADAYQARSILIFHEAFAYIAKDYGLAVSGGIDLDEERQVSAGEVADLLTQIREEGADVILAEELYGRRMCEAVQKEADVQVIYLDTCVRGDGQADSYLRAMERNLEQMEKLRHPYSQQADP